MWKSLRAKNHRWSKENGTMTESYAIHIAKGSAFMITQAIVTAITGTITFAFITRILTKTELGISVALNLTLAVAQLLSDLGFSRALAKYIAEYRGRNADYTFISFSGFLTKMSMAGLAALLCASASQQLSEILLENSEYAILFRLLSIDLFFFCMKTTMNNSLIGLNKVREMAIANIVATVTRQVFSVALLLHGWGLLGLVMGWILGDSLHMILSMSIAFTGKHIRPHSIEEIVPYLKMLAKFSWPLFFTSVVTFLFTWFDRAILIAYVPLSEVAVYSVAFAVFAVVYIVPSALGTALLPYFSEQYGKDEHEKIIVGVRAATRYTALLYTPLALGLMITAYPTVTLLGGQTYAGGSMPLAILSLIGGVSGISVALGALLVVYNMTPIILFIDVVSVGASLAVSYMLLPYLSATGMAIVKGVAMIVSLVLTILILRKRISVRFDKEAIWKSWTAAIAMIVAVGLTEQINSSWYLMPFFIVLGGLVYMITLRVLNVVKENDIQLLRNLVGNRAGFIVNILEKLFL